VAADKLHFNQLESKRAANFSLPVVQPMFASWQRASEFFPQDARDAADKNLTKSEANSVMQTNNKNF
jgi:hypothetical protein